MTKKKIKFKSASEVRSDFDIDKWVKGDSSIPAENTKEKTSENNDQIEKEELYRLSLDIPKYLHKRIKKTCAIDGVSIKAKLTDLLLNSFPEK